LKRQRRSGSQSIRASRLVRVSRASTFFARWQSSLLRFITPRFSVSKRRAGSIASAGSASISSSSLAVI
jgi:hypothetical protein